MQVNVGKLLQEQGGPCRWHCLVTRASHVFIQKSGELIFGLFLIEWLFYKNIGGECIISPVAFKVPSPVDSAVIEC
jgi:hypothetical protein